MTRNEDGPPRMSAGDAVRSAPRLLLDPTFGPFLLGKTSSTVGVWIHNIAAAITVFSLTRSATLVGVVTVGQFLPQLLFAPWAGARADRADRRRQMMLGLALAASGSGGLTTLILVGGLSGHRGAIAVICSSTVVGIGFTLSGPAMQALLPALVRPEDLPNAVALSALPHSIARAAGPAIGALLVTTAGPALAFGSAAVAHLIFAGSLALISGRPVDRAARGDRSVRAGWRYVRSDPLMLPLLLSVAAIGYGVDPAVTLSPAIADDLGADSTFVGSLASAFGLGAGVALMSLPIARRAVGLRRLGSIGLSMMALAMLGLALGLGSWAALIAMWVSGAGHTVALATLTTTIQQRVPEEFRGRVMASWSVAYLGSRPLASITSGSTADLVSLELALCMVAAIAAAGAWLVRPARLARAVA